MAEGILVERAVDHGQDGVRVRAAQATHVDEVLVVPEEEGPLRDLEVFAAEALTYAVVQDGAHN